MNDYLNLSLSTYQVKKILFQRKHKIIKELEEEIWLIEVNPSRKDLQLDLDLFEEIIKIYGYENIKSEIRNMNSHSVENKLILKNPFLSFTIRHYLSALGFNEVYNYSFIPRKIYDKVQSSLEKIGFLDNNSSKIGIQNTTNPNQKYLRYSLVYSLIDNIHTNITRGYRVIKIFEIGKVFKNEQEIEVLSGIIYGENLGFFNLKNLIHKFLSNFLKSDNFFYIPNSHNKLLNPFQSATIHYEKYFIGYIGGFQNILKEEFKWKYPPIFFELFLGSSNKIKGLKEIYESKVIMKKSYKDINLNPPIFRELTIDLNKNKSISYQEIQDVIYKNRIFLYHSDLISTYIHKESSKKSFTFLLYFEKAHTNLTHNKVNKEFLNITDDLKKNI